MSCSKKCRLCFKKLTRENTTELDENKLNLLVLKVFPSINLKLTNSVKICHVCYQKANYTIQFQDFIHFKRRYYTEVRQLKLTKRMCHICFKDYTNDSRKLLYKTSDKLNYTKDFVELALSRIKLARDAIFCKFCWTKAHKIYDFKKNCFETEEMLLKEVGPLECNLATSEKGVQTYLGELEEDIEPLQSMGRSDRKKNENVAQNANPHFFKTSEEVIETTIVFCEISDSDDDIFREESQDSDVDDIFDESCEVEPRKIGNSYNNISGSGDITTEVSKSIEIYKIEDRIDIKPDIDINDNHLNDEDIDDIFSEEECHLVENQNLHPEKRNEAVKSKDDDSDDVFEENINNELSNRNESKVIKHVVNSIVQQTTQKTVIGASFQHTERTVQIATHFTKTSENLFSSGVRTSSGVKRTSDMNSYLQTNISNKSCGEKRLKLDSVQVATEDHLSKKLSNSTLRDLGNNHRCIKEMDVAKKYVQKVDRNVGKTVLVGKLITHVPPVNRKSTKKKYKLPPLIPILKKLKQETKMSVHNEVPVKIHNPDNLEALGIKNEDSKSQIQETNTIISNKESLSNQTETSTQITKNYYIKDPASNENIINQTEVNTQVEANYYQQQQQYINYSAYYAPIQYNCGRNYCCNDARCPTQQYFEACSMQEIQWCCHVCMAKFGQKENLLKHFSYHRDPNFYWFHCKKCRFITISLYSVHEHIKYCKMEEEMFENRRLNETYVCHLCLMEFSEKFAVHNHIQQHEKMNCQCGSPHIC